MLLVIRHFSPQMADVMAPDMQMHRTGNSSYLNTTWLRSTLGVRQLVQLMNLEHNHPESITSAHAGHMLIGCQKMFNY